MNSKFLDYDYTQLRHFYAIAYFGGFSRASRATGLSQPALSSGLKKLESELGTQLILRTSRDFKLTPAGASLFDFCQETSTKWGSLHSSISERISNIPLRIRIGTAVAIGYGPLSHMIASLSRSERPIEAVLQMADSFQIVHELQEGKLDLAFLPDDVQSPQVHFEPAVLEPIILVASKENRLRVPVDRWRDSLAAQMLVNYPPDTPMRSIVDRVLIQQKLKFKSEVSVDGIEAMKLLVSRGNGLAFVLKSLVRDELKSGSIREIRIPITLPKRGITVACRANDRRQLRSLLDIAAKTLKSLH